MSPARSCALAGAVLAGAVAGGCLTPAATTCDDGRLCPADLACRPGGGGCVDPEQVRACAAPAVDGDPCMVATATGTCVDGVCEVGGCGNEMLEPGEACDDGNTTSGDGCRADCGKVELCGDAVPDEGEACDDGNVNPVDGCDACVVTAWSVAALLEGDVPAIEVGLSYPGDVAIDRGGNLLIADTVNQRIRRVDATTGGVTTLAGTGVLGAGGDGESATVAQLANPCGVAVDGRGVVYIADTTNDRIRVVDPRDGEIRTIAGSGVEGYGGDGGPAIAAALANPFAVLAAGDGTVYVSDTGNHRVRRVDAATGVITTIAGSGTQGFGGDGGLATGAALDEPHGLALEGTTALYVGDTDNHRVRRIDLTTGRISTVAGNGVDGDSGDGGLATSAALARPDRLAIGPDGALYVSDSVAHRVRRVDPVTRIISTVAGIGVGGFSGDGGPATEAVLRSPHGLAFAPDGALVLADADNHRIRRVAPDDGTITTVAGSGTIGYLGDGGAATAANLSYPWGIAIDGAGNRYVSDAYHQRVRRVDAATGVISTVAGAGLEGFGGDGGPAVGASLNYPWGLAVADDGTLYIADSENHAIRRVDPISGVITSVAGTAVRGSGGDGGPAAEAQLAEPHDVAIMPDGDLLIADSDNHRIRRVDADTGTISTLAGGPTAGDTGDEQPAEGALLDTPWGVEAEPDGSVLIADSGNNRIRRVTPDGQIHAVAGSGGYGASGDGGPALVATMRFPASLALDLDGSIFVTDTFSHRVRRVDQATGLIATVAGTGAEGAWGDRGPALAAAFRQPWAIAVDADGAAVVIDTYNHRVRELAPDGGITSIAGQLDPEGAGPAAAAHLADPRALVRTPVGTFFAGGVAGVVEAILPAADAVEVVAGRYPHEVATGDLARYRTSAFGEVGGVAFDPMAGAHGVLYVSEPSAGRLHAITVVDPAAPSTWTIAALGTALPGFADGPMATARFLRPTGLHADPATRRLYVADTGNHVVRAIDLDTLAVTTIAGTPATLGYFGDGGAAGDALLHAPTAITVAPDGDLLIADTGNHRVRRIAADDGVITTVLGDGVAASSGDGAPAWSFPVDAPRGLACDARGNVYVSSSTAVRLLLADGAGIVDGDGAVQTIYGAAPRDTYPALATSCLTGVAVVDDAQVHVIDACAGLLLELTRAPLAP